MRQRVGPRPRNEEPKSESLANQTAWAMVGELLLFASMIATFLVLPIRLSESEYGILGAIQGLLSPAIALCTFGAPALFIRRVAQKNDISDSWRRLLSVSVAGTGLATLLLILLKPWLLGSADLTTYVLLAVGEGSVAVHRDYAIGLFIGCGRMRDATLARGLAVVPRILAALTFLLLPNPSLQSWAVLTLVGGLLGLSANLLLVRNRYRPVMKPLGIHVIPGEVRKGYGFALTGISDGVLNASDRPIMINSGFGAAAGSYTLAYRVLSLALMPSLALMRATTQRVFADGAAGIRGPFAVAKKLSVPTAAIGIVVGVGLWWTAPLSSLFLGDKYSEFVDIIRWLAVLPVVKSLQFVYGNALDAARFQMWRFRLTLLAASLNLGLNLVLIPKYSWKAAVGTTIAAEILLTATTFMACWWLARHQNRSEGSVPVEVEL